MYDQKVRTDELYLVGDARSPRKAYEAIHEGFRFELNRSIAYVTLSGAKGLLLCKTGSCVCLSLPSTGKILKGIANLSQL